jgi:hypothetical protein
MLVTVLLKWSTLLIVCLGGKVSTSPRHARQFQHNSDTHDSHYASEPIMKDPASGDTIDDALIVAREMWSAFGDAAINIQSMLVNNRVLTCDDLTVAAVRAYDSSTARQQT